MYAYLLLCMHVDRRNIHYSSSNSILLFSVSGISVKQVSEFQAYSFQVIFTNLRNITGFWSVLDFYSWRAAVHVLEVRWVSKYYLLSFALYVWHANLWLFTVLVVSKWSLTRVLNKLIVAQLVVYKALLLACKPYIAFSTCYYKAVAHLLTEQFHSFSSINIIYTIINCKQTNQISDTIPQRREVSWVWH